MQHNAEIGFFTKPWGGSMVVLGLTGSIATGKSTVSGMLKELGAIIIDADKIAHEVVKKGLPAWQAIVKEFGKEVLLDNQEINRPFLGDIVFNDPEKRDILNRIVHPFVQIEMSSRLGDLEEKQPDSVVFLDVPLLIESNMHQSLKEILLVYIPEKEQIKRLIARDNIAEQDALARVRSQISIEEKKKFATILIDNSNSKEETRDQVIEIYARLMAF